jgi:hypothetical protein
MATPHLAPARTMLKRLCSLFLAFVIAAPLVGLAAEPTPFTLRCSLYRLEQDQTGGDHWHRADNSAIGSLSVDGQKWLIKAEQTAAAGTHVTLPDKGATGYVFYLFRETPAKDITYRLFVSSLDGRGLLYEGEWLIDAWNIPEYWAECALPNQAKARAARYRPRTGNFAALR